MKSFLMLLFVIMVGCTCNHGTNSADVQLQSYDGVRKMDMGEVVCYTYRTYGISCVKKGN